MRKEFILLVFICSLFSCDKIDNPLPTVYGDFNWNLYPNDPSTYPYNLTDPGSNWSTNTNPKGVLWRTIQVITYQLPRCSCHC